MGAKASSEYAGSYHTVSDRGDVKSDSYRYLRRTHERNNNKEKIYETAVCVLNHCFDDIEKFCARLQQVAIAIRDLERNRRKQNRNRRSKTKGEDYLLQLRASPPPEAEFIDIFQKLKLALNLVVYETAVARDIPEEIGKCLRNKIEKIEAGNPGLMFLQDVNKVLQGESEKQLNAYSAKLKFRLRDPTASQLIHYLLAPLSLLTNFSKDKSYGAYLASRAVAPLLTRESLSLLKKSLTPEETEIWMSLGESWTKTRDEWEGYVPPFYPVFYDGWAPDFPNIVTSTPIAPVRRQKEISDSL